MVQQADFTKFAMSSSMNFEAGPKGRVVVDDIGEVASDAWEPLPEMDRLLLGKGHGEAEKYLNSHGHAATYGRSM